MRQRLLIALIVTLGVAFMAGTPASPNGAASSEVPPVPSAAG